MCDDGAGNLVAASVFVRRRANIRRPSAGNILQCLSELGQRDKFGDRAAHFRRRDYYFCRVHFSLVITSSVPRPPGTQGPSAMKLHRRQTRTTCARVKRIDVTRLTSLLLTTCAHETYGLCITLARVRALKLFASAVHVDFARALERLLRSTCIAEAAAC